jgi:hypothetical protein
MALNSTFNEAAGESRIEYWGVEACEFSMHDELFITFANVE